MLGERKGVQRAIRLLFGRFEPRARGGLHVFQGCKHMLGLALEAKIGYITDGEQPSYKLRRFD